MRRLLSTRSITTIALISLIFFQTQSAVFAQQLNYPTEDELNLFKKIACVLLSISCSDSKTTNPNEPSPILTPPEIIQTPQPIKPGECSKPNGPYLCGARSFPLANCGHCGKGYPADQQRANCDNGKAEVWGTAYAIDIALKPFSPILLPSINGQNLTWTFYAQRNYSDNAIQRYRGIANNKTYVLQLHHTLIGSGIGNNKTALTGQVGAKVCPTCDHVHIQIMESGAWKPATNYYCTQS